MKSKFSPYYAIQGGWDANEKEQSSLFAST